MKILVISFEVAVDISCIYSFNYSRGKDFHVQVAQMSCSMEFAECMQSSLFFLQDNYILCNKWRYLDSTVLNLCPPTFSVFNYSVYYL